MKAEIIASGTELLLGETADTNTPYIANQLALLGIDLYYVSIVGDNYDRFLGVLRQAYQRADLVIITGGLGPTKGDITREVIAGLMEEKIYLDPDLKQQITGYFARLHLEMPENNLKQATLIPSSIALPNPLGSAPGWWIEKAGKIIISLPGPPTEMQPMWQKQVVPRLEKNGQAAIISRTLKTWGLSEAKIDQMVGHFMSHSNPTLALYAKQDGIHLRITAKAADRESSLKLISERETELRRILGEYIWGADKDTLEGIVSGLLLKKGLSLAVAESITGGLLSNSISGLPGSQTFYKGGYIILNDRTRSELGIGLDLAVKADLQSAIRMAALAREKFAADIGIAIDGFTAAEGAIITSQAFIAIDIKKGNYNITQAYPASIYQLIRRSVMHSFFILRKTLLELD